MKQVLLICNQPKKMSRFLKQFENDEFNNDDDDDIDDIDNDNKYYLTSREPIVVPLNATTSTTSARGTDVTKDKRRTAPTRPAVVTVFVDADHDAVVDGQDARNAEIDELRALLGAGVVVDRQPVSGAIALSIRCETCFFECTMLAGYPGNDALLRIGTVTLTDEASASPRARRHKARLEQAGLRAKTVVQFVTRVLALEAHFARLRRVVKWRAPDGDDDDDDASVVAQSDGVEFDEPTLNATPTVSALSSSAAHAVVGGTVTVMSSDVIVAIGGAIQWNRRFVLERTTTLCMKILFEFVCYLVCVRMYIFWFSATAPVSAALANLPTAGVRRFDIASRQWIDQVFCHMFFCFRFNSVCL